MTLVPRISPGTINFLLPVIRMATNRIKARPRPALGLNPSLHARLISHFGEVRIGNEGAGPLPGPPERDPRTGEIRSSVIDPGEAYSVCCPFCNDTRFRLKIHHIWCTPDPLTGKPLRQFAICYNADCLKSRYADLESLIFDPENAGDRRRREAMAAMRVQPGVVAQAIEGPPALPGECVPLAELPNRHPAIVYLTERGFDVATLVAQRDLSLCVYAEKKLAQVIGRIIVPITARFERVGWQARYVGELDWKAAGVPKYFTMPGFKAGSYLYGADVATELSPQLIIVVEGVADVWAAGPSAVAILGKSINPAKFAIIAGWAARGGLCLLGLDPGAWTTEVPLLQRERVAVKHAELIARFRREFFGRLVEIQLNDADPAQLGHAAFHAVLAKQTAAAGFNLHHFTPGGRPPT